MNASANPVMPIPIRRAASSCLCCIFNGTCAASMALSSKRVATAVVAPIPARSSLACAPNGSCTNWVRLIEPRLHAPCGGKGTSPQGLVALMDSSYQRLLLRAIRSMNSTPGSPVSHAVLCNCSHNNRAGTVRTTTQGSGVIECDQIRSSTNAPCGATLPASGNTSIHSSFFSSACMNASLTSTDRLKCRKACGSRLA